MEIEGTQRIKDQIELWNKRGRKQSFKSVMCSDFTDNEAQIAGLAQRQILDKLFSKISGKTALEIGAGNGRLTAFIRTRVSHVVALDLSPVMLQQIPSQEGIFKVVGDAVVLPFRKNAFDVVVATNILGHIHSKNELRISLQSLSAVIQNRASLILDEMTGNYSELVGGHYLVRKPNEYSNILHRDGWTLLKQYLYSFGPQPHCASLFRKGF